VSTPMVHTTESSRTTLSPSCPTYASPHAVAVVMAGVNADGSHD
jgi:hypothetical protein